MIGRLRNEAPDLATLIADERMPENEGTRNRRAKRAELGSAPYGRVWPHQMIEIMAQFTSSG
jgi:hypothetical protein